MSHPAFDWEKLYEDSQHPTASPSKGQDLAPADWEARYLAELKRTVPSLAPLVVNADPPPVDAGTFPPTVVSSPPPTIASKDMGRLVDSTVRHQNAHGPVPGVPPMATAEATRVGAAPNPGHYTPGSIEKGLTMPLQMVAQFADHPIDATSGLVLAPLKAAYTANLAAAEQQASNDLAMSGGKLGPDTNYGQAVTAVPRTVTPRDAAIASLQVGATLAAPEISRVAGGLLSRALNPTLATALGHMTSSGTVMAAFTPDDPVAGFIGGALLATPWGDAADAATKAAAQVRPRVAQLYEAVKALKAEPGAGVADAQASLARVVAGLDEKDLAYASNDPHFGPVFRQALEQHGIQMPPAPNVLRGLLEPLGETGPDALRRQLGLGAAGEGTPRLDPQFAANATRSLADLAAQQRERAKAANPPQAPEPFTEKPLPPAPSIQGDVTPEHLIDYADTHNVPVMTAARAFQQAGHDVPDPIAKDAFSQSLSRDEEQPSGGETVRFYHGGAPYDRGSRWLTPDRAYAEAYAKKSGGVVQSVDVPADSPLLRKAYDDTGTNMPAPYASFEAPAEIAQNLRPLNEQPIGAGMSDVETAARSRNAAQQLQEHAQFPMTVEHLLDHSEAKGTTIPESAETLRRAGYTVPPELERAAQVAQMRRGMTNAEPPTAEEIRAEHGETFGDQRERAAQSPPASVDWEQEYERQREREGPIAHPTKRGMVLDTDGVARFPAARTDGGKLRAPAKVTTDGLIEELLHVDTMQESAEKRAQYEYRQDENFHSTEDGRTVVAATRRGGKGPSEQAKALTNLDAFKRRRDAIYEELQGRGLDHESIYDRYTALRDRATEREGLKLDAEPRGRPQEFVTDPETGEVLFSKLPDQDTGDLFGENRPQSRQEGLFGEREGTEASRPLAATERAARAELERQRLAYGLTRDPDARQQVAQRIAQLEKLVNRDRSISPQELSTQLEAEHEGNAPESPEQGGFFNDEARAARRPEPVRGPGGILERPAPRTETPDMAIAKVNPYWDSLKKRFAPASRGPDAGITARVIRERAAEIAMRDARAAEALKGFGNAFDKMPIREQLEFIDRMEKGLPQKTPLLTQAAAKIRELLDTVRDEIRGMGTGALHNWIENYFPHIWENADHARGVIARMLTKRSLTGSRSFLERRTIPFTMDGIEAGLVPISHNPVDLTLLKLHEMNRYLLGLKIMRELAEQKIARFVKATEKAPAGFKPIDDRVAKVFGRPTVSAIEGFDANMEAQLHEIVRSLGVKFDRARYLGHPLVMGRAERSGEAMATRYGAPQLTPWHELGHVLDVKFQLWRRLHEFDDASLGEGLKAPQNTPDAIAYRKQIDGELRNLADLRAEGAEDQLTASHRDYLHNRYEKMANALGALVYAPERLEETAPLVASRLRDILAEDPRSAKLLDVRRSLVEGARQYEIPVGGLVVKGQYHAPEPAALVINNYLSPGLRGNPWFDAYMGVGGVMNMAQLAYSAFHLGFVTLDSTVSKMALAIHQLAAGKITDAGISAAKAITPFYAAIETGLAGDKVLKEYLRPGTQGGDLAQIVDALQAAGGRATQDAFYRMNYGRRLLELRKLAVDHFQKGDYLSASSAGARAILKTIPATIEWSSKWLMEGVVPRMKDGVFADLARHELEQLPPNPTRDQVRAALGRVSDSVDNRLGLVVHDNVFWNRAFRDLTHASVRSVGWNLGTFRELGGGAADLVRAPGRFRRGETALTPAMAYLIALPITVGFYGALLGYLYTGKAPEELKDYYYPKTGRKNADGTDERVQPPSYVRDAVDMSRHPFKTIGAKAHPALVTAIEMLQNKDYYGNKIVNGRDPLMQELQQAGSFIGKQYIPIGVQNYRQQTQQGQSLGTRAQNFVGITPAPREIVRTPALNLMADILNSQGPTGLTPEQVDRRNERRDVLKQMRGGDVSGGIDQLRHQVQSGQMSEQRGNAIAQDAAQSPIVAQFKRLQLKDALDVYSLGKPEEQHAWRDVMAQKLDNARPGAVTSPQMALQIREVVKQMQRSQLAGALSR